MNKFKSFIFVRTYVWSAKTPRNNFLSSIILLVCMEGKRYLTVGNFSLLTLWWRGKKGRKCVYVCMCV